MIEEVRHGFLGLIANTHLQDFFNNDDVQRVLKDDKWISRCYSMVGDVSLAIVSLTGMLAWRASNNIYDKLPGEELSDHENFIKKYGKDKNGRALLTFNISEIESCTHRSDTFLGDLIVRWFEELDRGVHDKFSVVLFHGANKNMERLPELFLLIQKIAAGYRGFLETIYIFEDVLSHGCRERIRMCRSQNNVQIKYVNTENVSKVLKFDLALYLGSKVEPHQEKKKNNNPTNKRVEENVSEELLLNKEAVKETKTKEVSDVVQSIEENKNGDKLLRETLKRLLRLQKELNSIISDIITNL